MKKQKSLIDQSWCDVRYNVDTYKCIFSYNRIISHVYIFDSHKSVEQQEGGHSKTVPNLSISDLKMTHLCDTTGEALFTTLTYCGARSEEQVSHRLQFRRHESISNLQVNVSYANTENHKTIGMRV